ncbi:hypothetical protein L1N85_03035 [Paenibacillus alkaliterrae]|uniref:hypothetical protein n=1 Tax=Paenibacillus alkaliterrae TaxID=320909 RepID=UPI001F1E799E|nr:hypothetical protein [Paenibacillus alkaliterrae]MCF2937403.1 hypothetical protein [Paenibacillus alkaliterrae]
MKTKKLWSKPQLEFLHVHMTEAATYTRPDHDEAYNGDTTATYPNGDFVEHHVS